MIRTYEVRNPWLPKTLEEQSRSGVALWCVESDGREFFGETLDDAFEAQALHASLQGAV